MTLIFIYSTLTKHIWRYLMLENMKHITIISQFVTNNLLYHKTENRGVNEN